MPYDMPDGRTLQGSKLHLVRVAGAQPCSQGTKCSCFSKTWEATEWYGGREGGAERMEQQTGALGPCFLGQHPPPLPAALQGRRTLRSLTGLVRLTRVIRLITCIWVFV